MKNKTFILTIIFLVVLTTTAVLSCKKDKQEATDNTELVKTPKTVNGNVELSDFDEDMMAFGERLRKSSSERNGETLSITEGLRTLGNYQNFMLCDASCRPDEMVTETVRVSLNAMNGQVSFAELNRVYESARSAILSRYALLNGNEKTIYLIANKIVSEPRGNLDNLTGSVDIEFIARMGNLSDRSGFMPVMFDTTDYWYDFDTVGKCDIYVGQCPGRNCISELNSKLHSIWHKFQCPQGYRVVFTNITADLSKESSNYPDSSSPNGIYAWPWRLDLSSPQCVDPYEMGWYLNAIYDDMIDLEENDDDSRNIVDFSLDKKRIRPSKDLNYVYTAYLTYTLANITCSLVGPVN